MKMKNLYILFAVVIFFSACKKKEFDMPPVKDIPAGARITIKQAIDTIAKSGGFPVKFLGDRMITGVVTADERSGNLYKNVFLQDETGAINVKLMSAGGLYQGDSIRINLNTCILSEYRDMPQIDSVDVLKAVVKIVSGKSFITKNLNINQIKTSDVGYVVTFDSVQMTLGDTSKTWADAIGKSSQDRILTDCNGNTVLVRTSGYCNFAGTKLAKGYGSLTAVVGIYNGTYQLYLRDLKDVNLNGARPCDPYMAKNFDDLSVTSGGWINYNNLGQVNWSTETRSSRSYAVISNYNGTSKSDCDSWLISPEIDLTNTVNPVFTFNSAVGYTGPVLGVRITDNFISDNPGATTWIPLSATLPSSSGTYFTWTASGDISLSAYQGKKVRIMLQYQGSTSAGSTWEIDDLIIKEK